MTKTKERLTIGLLAVCLVTFVVSVDALTRPVAMHEIDTAARTVIWSEPQDPYYDLAREIARTEDLPLADALDAALAQAPEFLIWVVSPEWLSERIFSDFGAALQQHSKAVFPITPESVIHHVGIAPGQSDTVEFGLRASRPGQSVLAASAGFEFHSGYPGPAYWASESSGPLYVTVMPLEPELVPEGDLACLISAEVPVKVCLPRGYLISRSAQRNRRGSLVSYHLTPAEGSETPYLMELQFFTEASIKEFAQYCEEYSPCFFGDYPDLARYHGQREALERSEPVDGYELGWFNDRASLVSILPCHGDDCVIREYTTFVGDIKVDVWVLVRTESEAEASDRLLGDLTISGMEGKQ